MESELVSCQLARSVSMEMKFNSGKDTNSTDYPYKFTLKTNKKVSHLYAHAEDERQLWVSKISQVIQSVQNA